LLVWPETNVTYDTPFLTGNLVETALWRSEERLRLAQDAGGVASWEHDLASGEVQWSQSAYRLFGLAPDWQPSFENFLERVHPEDRDSVRSTVERAIVDKRALDHQFRILTPGGEQRWIVSRAKFINDKGIDEPTNLRLIGIDIDITSLKETEQRLQKREQEL
jgi:PAS domain S-box-containing protein